MDKTHFQETGTSDPELGPLIYGERLPITWAVSQTLVGIVLLVIGVGAFFLPNRMLPAFSNETSGIVAVLAGLGVGIYGLVVLVRNIRCRWQLHELGVMLIRGENANRLRYDHIGEMTHKIVRNFYSGMCISEEHDVILVSESATAPTRIQFNQVRKPKKLFGGDLNQQDELGQVCDQIAALIAKRMAAKLGKSETVPWAPGYVLRPEGVEFSKTAEVMHWKDVDRYEFTDGVFQLWRHGEPKPVLKIPTGACNFFPGFVVLSNRTQANPDQKASML